MHEIDTSGVHDAFLISWDFFEAWEKRKTPGSTERIMTVMFFHLIRSLRNHSRVGVFFAASPHRRSSFAFLRVVLSFPFQTDSRSPDRPFANLAARQKVNGWMEIFLSEFIRHLTRTIGSNFHSKPRTKAIDEFRCVSRMELGEK